MPHVWALQDAKAKFSEVVKLATTEGPQLVTCRGVETAVILSVESYRQYVAKRPSFISYLLSGPRLDDDTIAILNDRSMDPGRDLEF